MNPESGVQAAPVPRPAGRRRWRWWLLAVFVVVIGWAARVAWIRRTETAAIRALNQQEVSVVRGGFFPREITYWIRKFGFETPSGRVTKVSCNTMDGDSKVSDLSMLSVFPRLEEIAIRGLSSGPPLSESAQTTLAGTPAFPRLRVFHISMPTSLPDDFFKRFAHCPDLELFAVVNSQFTDEGMRSLSLCTRIRFLSIRNSRVHRGMNLLSLPMLREFHASDTPIDSTGLEGLRRCGRLESVDLSGTAVDDAGLEILAGLPTLKHVFLDRTRVTRSGIEKLLKARAPRSISLTETAVTIDDAIELSKQGFATLYVGTTFERVRVQNGAIEKPDEN